MYRGGGHLTQVQCSNTVAVVKLNGVYTVLWKRMREGCILPGIEGVQKKEIRCQHLVWSSVGESGFSKWIMCVYYCAHVGICSDRRVGECQVDIFA